MLEIGQRVRDKRIRIRRWQACGRAQFAGLLFVIFGLLTFVAGLENIIVLAVKNNIVALFLIQDALLVIYGIFTFILGLIYPCLGMCQFFSVIRNNLRIGRRTLLHIVHILTIPILIYIVFGIIGEAIYQRKTPKHFPNGTAILPSTIWVGFNGQTTVKGIYSIIMYTVTLMCIILYWISVFYSSTFHFLVRKDHEAKVQDYVKQLREEDPKISVICRCYMLSEKKIRDRTVTRVKKEEIETSRKQTTLHYSQCFDASGPIDFKGDNPLCHCIGLKYVKLRLSWCYVWDRRSNQYDFDKFCQNFVEECKEENEYSRLKIKAELPHFEPRVLLRMSKYDPWWCSTFFYVLCSFFGLSLLYRHIFDMVCTEKEYKIIKRVSTDQEINRKKVYDQTDEDKDRMGSFYFCHTPSSLTEVDGMFDGIEGIEGHMIDPELTPFPFQLEYESDVFQVDTREKSIINVHTDGDYKSFEIE